MFLDIIRSKGLRLPPKGLPEDKIVVINIFFTKMKFHLKIIKFVVDFRKSILGSYSKGTPLEIKFSVLMRLI